MKKSIFIVSILLMVLLLAISVEASYPLRVVDDTGSLTMIPRKPMRIVSLAPSHTEILFALGLGDRVVGRTNVCDYPAEASKVVSVGDYYQPSFEAILALRPDLVISSFGNPGELLDQIRDLGIPVLGYNPETIEGVLKTVWEIGKVTGAEAEATVLVASMRERITTIQNLVKDVEKPVVFWEVWHDPIYTAGSGTFIHDMITYAGGVNLGAEAGNGWPIFSLEVLLVRDPAVYIATEDHSANPGNIHGRPGYNQLAAVKNNRVYIVNADNVNRPGPRVIDGLEEIARAIHPDLFE